MRANSDKKNPAVSKYFNLRIFAQVITQLHKMCMPIYGIICRGTKHYCQHENEYCSNYGSVSIRFTMTGSTANKQQAANKRNKTDRLRISRVSKFLVLCILRIVCKSWTNIEWRRLCVNTDFTRLVQITDRSNTDGDPTIYLGNEID